MAIIVGKKPLIGKADEKEKVIENVPVVEKQVEPIREERKPRVVKKKGVRNGKS